MNAAFVGKPSFYIDTIKFKRVDPAGIPRRIDMNWSIKPKEYGSKWNPYLYNLSGTIKIKEGNLLDGLNHGDVPKSHELPVLTLTSDFLKQKGVDDSRYGFMLGPNGIGCSTNEPINFLAGPRYFQISKDSIKFYFENVPLIQGMYFKLLTYAQSWKHRVSQLELCREIFATEGINYRQSGLSAEHPYTSALRKIDGNVTSRNCLWLNKNFIAPDNMNASLRGGEKSYDYMFKPDQIPLNEKIARGCSLPIVEFGMYEGGKWIKQCSGIIISPFGDILTVYHAVKDDDGIDIVNYVRRGRNRRYIASPTYLLKEKELDLTVIRVSLSILQDFYGSREIPVAPVSFDPVEEQHILVGTHPHIGYPQEETELLFLLGKIREVLSSGEFCAVTGPAIKGTSGGSGIDYLGYLRGILTGGLSRKLIDYENKILHPGQATVFRGFWDIRSKLVQAVPFLARGFK